jgi:hypothetical protein
MMFNLLVVVLTIFGAGFAAGYGLRALISRRRRSRRVFLPPVTHFPGRESFSKKCEPT